jgi:hypothetical protein
MMTYETSDLTRRQVLKAYRRIDALQTGLRALQTSLEPGGHLIATKTEMQQYRRLLDDLRNSGMTIAPWHDLELDPGGTFSGHALQDALDVLTKLVEDATDTRTPTGSLNWHNI